MELWLVLLLIVLSPLIFIAGVFGLIFGIMFIVIVFCMILWAGHMIYYSIRLLITELKLIKIKKSNQ